MLTRVDVGKLAFWCMLALAAVLLAAPKTLRFASELSDPRVENEIERLTQLFFFRDGDTYGVFYDGQMLSYRCDDIVHYMRWVVSQQATGN